MKSCSSQKRFSIISTLISSASKTRSIMHSPGNIFASQEDKTRKDDNGRERSTVNHTHTTKTYKARTQIHLHATTIKNWKVSLNPGYKAYWNMYRTQNGWIAQSMENGNYTFHILAARLKFWYGSKMKKHLTKVTRSQEMYSCGIKIKNDSTWFLLFWNYWKW